MPIYQLNHIFIVLLLIKQKSIICTVNLKILLYIFIIDFHFFHFFKQNSLIVVPIHSASFLLYYFVEIYYKNYVSKFDLLKILKYLFCPPFVFSYNIIYSIFYIMCEKSSKTLATLQGFGDLSAFNQEEKLALSLLTWQNSQAFAFIQDSYADNSSLCSHTIYGPSLKSSYSQSQSIISPKTFFSKHEPMEQNFVDRNTELQHRLNQWRKNQQTIFFQNQNAQQEQLSDSRAQNQSHSQRDMEEDMISQLDQAFKLNKKFKQIRINHGVNDWKNRLRNRDLHH